MKHYDTQEKRLKFLRRKSSIITFKEPIYPWGRLGEPKKQILSLGLQMQRGSVKIVGLGFDSPWYSSIEELLDKVDWDWLESNSI